MRRVSEQVVVSIKQKHELAAPQCKLQAEFFLSHSKCKITSSLVMGQEWGIRTE